jgi:formylglycine-generating enzyme required for sulfatase activity
MKNLMLSIFTLLLFAAATTTATAQEAKPKLAVLVVGMNDWMIGDVLAHLVGEELNRDKSYEVVTRRNDVQNKLEALRRGADDMDESLLRTWADGQGINTLCVVTTTSGLNFSLKLLGVSSGDVHCSGSSVEPNAVALKQLAWSLTGSIGDGCTPFESCPEPEPCPTCSTCPTCPTCPICPSDNTESLMGMKMVYVEGGPFMMGCVSGRDDLNGHTCNSNEQPSHEVWVDDFLIGKYEVTQAQWEAVMGTAISQQSKVGPNYPVHNVTWYEAQAFCDTLSARTGKAYRLPTEEEWEYAARGGNSSESYVYSGGDSIGRVAWHNGNAGSSVHMVGGKSKNELGIHDMSGNVFEWCSSVWRSSYSSSPSGSYRVFRGGSWNYDA